MIRISLFACLSICQATTAFGQVNYQWLPKSAVVLETRQLIAAQQQNRMLVLWMLNPKKYPNNYKSDDPYTCPDETRGSNYSGPTRVSLIDASTTKLINTLKVLKDYEEPNDEIDLPYAIRKGYYYHVPGRAPATMEVKPTIMWLKDYNGDGKSLEFALFDAEACMGLATTLIGYSEKQDRVVQYPIELTIVDEGKHTTQTQLWADYLMNKKPVSAGYWKYEIDYRGRGGSLDKWEVKYNPTIEQLEGSLTRLLDQP